MVEWLEVSVAGVDERYRISGGPERYSVAISVMKCVLNLDERGQELTMNVPDVTQLINYPASANYSSRVLFFPRVFHRPGQKAENLHAEPRISVVLRPASSAHVQTPTPGILPAGGVCCPPTDEAGHGRVLRMEGTELMSLE